MHNKISKLKYVYALLMSHFICFQEFTSFQKNLTASPDGYNSVKGVKSSDDQPSDFKVRLISLNTNVTM